MKFSCQTLLIMILNLLPVVPALAEAAPYPWVDKYEEDNAIVNRISPPKGFERVKADKKSFQYWLRHLPLQKGRPPVLLFNGAKKANQKAHHAVIDIDIGKKNLQQCADAIIRLRAEYLYFAGLYKAIHFNFTSGDKAEFAKWAIGDRPVVRGNKVSWRRSGGKDDSYTSLKKYLETVFTYAGSASLSKEMEKVENIKDARTGDVFIRGGFPGHAVIIVDMAVNLKTGKKVFLLAQSYMPAQNVHILRNPAGKESGPWYDLDFGQALETPEWEFTAKELKRFPPQE